ncbi:MAG: hypothetical protein JKY04_03670 [Sneathiella sp.]|nr:hypothetical protein [Sneathiella sp.]
MAKFFTVGKYRTHNRRDHRHELPLLSLVVAGRHVKTYDWSLGGFRIADFQGRPPVGEGVIVSELSYSPEHRTQVSCKATVTRIILGKNQVAFSFKELDEDAFAFLEAASIQRLSILANQK